MKKFLLSTILLLCTIVFAQAQENLFGARVGLNVTNLDFRPEVPEGVLNAHRNGFAIGFIADYGISRKFSIMPEIQFSAEGAKDDGLRLDYIQMPILFNYKFCDKISLGVGPQVSLKAHDYEDGFQNIVYAGIAGATYMISDVFFFDVRFSYGLTNVFDDNTGLEAINKNLQFGFGLKM